MAEYEHHECRESSTTAKTALGLSIGALGAELLGLGGGNLLGGVLGRNGNAVTPEVISAMAAVVPTLVGNGGRCCDLKSEIAQLKAEMYANNTGINTFKEAQILVEKQAASDSAKFEKLFDQVVKDAVADARMEEQLKCLQKDTDHKIDSLRAEMKLGFTNLGHAIEVESERRANGDAQIKDWTLCNFVQYKRVIDASQICPPVQLASGTAANASNVVVSGTVTTQAAA